MKNHPNISGLTLAELLITSVIIGIIMLGVVSVDFAIRSNELQQSRTAIVTLKTSTMLKEIELNAMQAVGDFATRCVQLGNITTDATNYICVYRDDTTPADYSDDYWKCFTRHGTNLHACTRTLASGKGACATTDRIIGGVTIDTFDAPDTPVVTSTNPNLYVEFTLKSRYDPARPNPGIGAVDNNGAKYSVAIAQEFLKNPKVKMKTRVAPAGCGAT